MVYRVSVSPIWPTSAFYRVAVALAVRLAAVAAREALRRFTNLLHFLLSDFYSSVAKYLLLIPCTKPLSLSISLNDSANLF